MRLRELMLLFLYRSSMKHMGWYAYKAETRRYLEELNKDKKVNEIVLVNRHVLTRSHY